jgi:sialic acid synthase SpsE
MQSPKRVYIIAELCSNAAPFDDARLEAFCRAAADAGADAVKVQLFLPDHFPEAEREAKRAVQFPRGTFPEFVAMAHSLGMEAGASVFDPAAVAIAAGGDFVKLATREETNLGLRFRCRELDIPVLRSVRWPAVSTESRSWLGETTLGCIPEYPVSDDHSALISLRGLPDLLSFPYGWSSHTRGWEDVIAAVRAGATVIEKHLKLSDEDPEAEWSLNPQQFAEMVKQIREAEK